VGRSSQHGWCVYDARTLTYSDIAPPGAGWRWSALLRPPSSRARLIAGPGAPLLVLALVPLLITVWLGLLWLGLPDRSQTLERSRSLHITLIKRADGRVTPARGIPEYSLNIPVARLPPHLKQAVLATEDRLLYSTHHVTYLFARTAQAMLGCAARYLVHRSTSGCPGNSTITQQVAKLLWPAQPSRTVSRKLRELLWALKLEWQLTPDEILQIYLNRIPLGQGTVGVEQAARHHFGKSAHELDLYESALLIAALKRPLDNVGSDRPAAIARADIILDAMFRYGYLPRRERIPEAVGQPVHRARRRSYLGHYAQWVMPEAHRLLERAPPGRYKVYTHADAEVHLHAEAALRRTTDTLRRSGVPAPEGALVAMRPDGRVLAMIGGTGDDVGSRSINRAVPIRDLHCPPAASALKPVVYTVALESGLTPESLVDASPVEIALPSGARYRPRNHGHRVHDTLTLREGLAGSVNTAAIRLALSPGAMRRWRDVASRFGLDDTAIGYQLGDVIGQPEVCLIDLTRLYAIVSARGRDVSPSGIHAIVDENGHPVYERVPRRGRQRFAQRHMDALHGMLVDAVGNGTGHRAGQGLTDLRIAGKTGTADDNTDALFVGYTDDLVVGVWIGSDAPVPMPGVTGGTAPARVFNSLLHRLR